jgi:hypothetical protein
MEDGDFIGHKIAWRLPGHHRFLRTNAVNSVQPVRRFRAPDHARESSLRRRNLFRTAIPGTNPKITQVEASTAHATGGSTDPVRPTSAARAPISERLPGLHRTLCVRCMKHSNAAFESSAK